MKFNPFHPYMSYYDSTGGTCLVWNNMESAQDVIIMFNGGEHN